MKILIDIGHPGHVHYFRNFYKIMKSKGHDFLFISRDKEVTFSLLNYYKIPYKSRGKGKKSFLGKLFYILYADYIILKNALKFKPDIFLSFSSTYMGHVAFLMRKPNVIIDDTEHAKFEHIMYKPFASVILTPSCFYKNMGEKQIKFNSYTELFYLHKNYFNPKKEILNILGVKEEEKFAIIRFVSWGASHDFGHSGFNNISKLEIIKEIDKHIKVFITSETKLPPELEKYRIKISPEQLHDALKYSSIYIGEGGTTASETSILGIPTLYINSIPLMGYLKDEEKLGILHYFKNELGVLAKTLEILNDSNYSEKYNLKAQKLIKNKIDPTSFLVWFIENYPESVKIMRENPDYQNNFR
ncbi:MAG: DUF354 domain-containing protein [Bacteroidales bacterium]